MHLGRFLIGILLIVPSLGSVVAGSVAVRRRVVPTWRGVDALIVDAVLALSALTLLAEALGTVGQLRMRNLIVGSVAVGGAAWWWARRDGAGADAGDETDTAETDTAETDAAVATRGFAPWSIGAAVVAATLAVGSWISRTLTALDQGITTVDSHWYHLPFAIHFLQTGRTTDIHYTDDVTAYFPATSSLFHAMGMMFFRTDILSTVLNLGWLALAVGAAWSIGRHVGVAPISALGALVLLGAPVMVETQAGGALTDVVGCALFLSAVAITLVPRAERTMAPDVLAAMAAGLSTGTKFTFLPAAGALCLGLVAIAPSGQRLRRAVGVFGAIGATGAYWYVRNLFAIGNPLPSVDVGIGSYRLTSVHGPLPSSMVIDFLRDDGPDPSFVTSGLRDALGPGWPAVLALALAGAVAAIVRSDARLRMLGVVAMVCNVAYVLTPQFLLDGTFFATNLRYAAPGMILGLVLLPVALDRFRSWLLPLYAALLVVTQLDRVSWPFGFSASSLFEPVERSAAIRGGVVSVVLLAAVVAVAWAWPRSPAPRYNPVAVAVAVPLLLLAGLTAVHGRYVDGRYRGPMPFPNLTVYAQDLSYRDIAVYGPYIYLKSPFAGADLTNRVQYLYMAEDGGHLGPGGGQSRPPATCEEWVGLLEAGAYHYVFVVDRPAVPGPIQWTEAQPDARLVAVDDFGEGEARAYRLDPTTRRSCGA